MKPRGPLMIEHRLIERMIDHIRQEIPLIRRAGKVDPVTIDTVVDFIRMYADRTHHGKEEDILFSECVKKKMAAPDSKIMHELIEEHRQARQLVKELVEAKEQYSRGEDTLDVILGKLESLTQFYPVHIEKEDKVFFPNTEQYFSEQELQFMLDEFWEFDRKMIHEKYKQVVDQLQLRSSHG